MHIWLLQHITLYQRRFKITSLSWVFRHFCIYKQPTFTKQWSFNIFVQILYSYFRWTCRLFIGCALFVAGCNTIRTSWEPKKERLSYRKRYIQKSVWKISIFGLHALPSMSSYFLCPLSPASQVMYLQNGSYKDTYIAIGGFLCDDIISKWSKIWKSII